MRVCCISSLPVHLYDHSLSMHRKTHGGEDTMLTGLIRSAIRELRYDRTDVLARTTPMLRNINIETAYDCNMNCTTCTRRARPRVPFMAVDLFEGIIRDLKTSGYNGCLYLHYAGEPLLHPEMERMIRFLRDEGWAGRVHLYSNGILLTEANMRMLRDNGVRIVNVSIDGDERYNNENRSPGSYEGIIENLKRLSRDHGDWFDVTVQAVLFGQSEETLQGLIRDVGPLVNKLRVTPGFDQATMTLNTNPFGRSYPVVNMTSRTCPVLWSGMTVLSDGTCNACCFELAASKQVPDIDLNRQSVQEAFTSESYNRIRQKFLDRQFEGGFESCRNCVAWRVGRVNLPLLRVKRLGLNYVVVTNGYTDKYYFLGRRRKTNEGKKADLGQDELDGHDEKREWLIR